MVRRRCVWPLDGLNVRYYDTVPIWKFGWCLSPNGGLVWLNVANFDEIVVGVPGWLNVLS